MLCRYDCNAIMCSGLCPNLLAVRGWERPPEQSTGQRGTGSVWPGACPAVQNPRRKGHAGHLRVRAQSHPTLPGLGF